MSTDQDHAPEGAPEGASEQAPATSRPPSWWHRDHPTFTALSGFFSGLVFVIVVPGLFAAILNLLFSDSRAEDLYPFVLVTLAVPLGLIIVRRTRRFGIYLLIGMVTTAVVIGGVAALVLWYMVTYQG